MSALIKLSSDSLNLLDILFIRSFIALLLLLPLLKIMKQSLETKYFKIHLLRSILGVIAMTCMFYSIINLPLSNVIVISFSKIFFIIPLAFFVFNERIKVIDFVLIFIGFIGIIVVIGIENDNTNLIFYSYALFGSFIISCVKILVKKLSLNEPALTIQFWFSLLSSAILLLPYLHSAKLPNMYDFLILILASVSGLIAQYFTIKALKVSEAIVVLPFDFSRIIFGILLGFIFFSETLSLTMFIGTVIIIFSGVFLIRIKRR